MLLSLRARLIPDRRRGTSHTTCVWSRSGRSRHHNQCRCCCRHHTPHMHRTPYHCWVAHRSRHMRSCRRRCRIYQTDYLQTAVIQSSAYESKQTQRGILLVSVTFLPSHPILVYVNVSLAAKTSGIGSSICNAGTVTFRRGHWPKERAGTRLHR
jgi:hypothetical protein